MNIKDITNEKLIEIYPFIVPRKINGEKQEEKNIDKSFTLLNNIPNGWKQTFGILLCEDLKQELIKIDKLENFYIIDIKEKYGELRIDCSYMNENINQILNDYQYLSSRTCCNCGKIGVPIFDNGWVSPWCNCCFKTTFYNGEKNDEKLNKFIIDDSDFKSNYTITIYKNGKHHNIEHNISHILNRINKEKVHTI